MQKPIEVALQANLKLNDSPQQPTVEIVGLSISGALIRSPLAPQIGEKISINLKEENLSTVVGKVEKYANWNGSQKVFYLRFDELTTLQSQAVLHITDYYSKLKRAGVQLDSPLKEGSIEV